jgi:PadR family transcriptional regulator PadR
MDSASDMAGKVESDFFVGSIRLHILHHATKGEVFGLGLIDELHHDGYRLSPGTLYPILHSLEHGGYLRSAFKQVAGKRRRIYVATAGGTKALAASRAKVLALFQEILGDQVTSSRLPKSVRRRVAPRPSKLSTNGTDPASGQCAAPAGRRRFAPNHKKGKSR